MICFGILFVVLQLSRSQICTNSGRECTYSAGECCSSSSYCGTGDAWCNENSLYGYGSTDTDTGTTADCPDCLCDGETSSPTSSKPTSSPVARPVFNAHCHCKCWGDPHCQMWNCKTNNYQGPHYRDSPGQFYYVTPCYGHSHDDMPFDLIGAYQRYDNSFTSIDYTILKLYGDDDDVYCIKAKGNYGVKYNTDCGDTYDESPSQRDTISLGDKFEISWENINGAVYLYLNVLDDGNDCSEDNDVTIITTTATSKEEGFEVKISSCYEKYTCGMCGNFYDEGLYFERNDGSHMTLSEGCWGGSANHEDGLSYVVSGTMGSRRRLQDTDTDGEPCYGYYDDILSECESEIESYSECCDEREDFCDNQVVEGCSWDSCSCVMATDEVDVDDSVISNCVVASLEAAMNFTCILPADDFLIPELYNDTDTDTDSLYGCPIIEPCPTGGALYIFYGILIGAILFIIIDVIIYYAWIQQKLKPDAYNGVETEEEPINQ